MKFILGKKLKMERIYLGDRITAVTVVSAGPCQVVQCKSNKTDKYMAAQIGFGYAKKINKPKAGQVKGLANFKYLKEFRLDSDQTVVRGQVLNVKMFTEGEKVKVTGISKGKGYQGVVKRHGFGGFRATHGNKDQQRMPGSIGATDAGRVFKGMRMAGHMGFDTVTIANLKIVKIDVDKNLLYIAGAVPGATDGLLFIKAEGMLPEVSNETPAVEEIVSETPVAEEKVEEKLEEVTVETPAVEEVKKDIKEEVETPVAEEIKEEEKESASA